MKVVLIIAGIGVALCIIMFVPWLVFGAAAVIFCFWNEWYVAGVIAGLFAIFAQVAIGSSLWNDAGFGGGSHTENSDDGFGAPEMFIAYKFGEQQGKDKED